MLLLSCLPAVYARFCHCVSPASFPPGKFSLTSFSLNITGVVSSLSLLPVSNPCQVFCVPFLASLLRDFAPSPNSTFLFLYLLSPLFLSVHLGLLQTITQKPPVSATALTRRTVVLLQNHRQKLLYQSLLQATLKTWWGNGHH